MSMHWVGWTHFPYASIVLLALLLLCPGVWAQHTTEAYLLISNRVVVLDLVSGKELAEIALPRPLSGFPISRPLVIGLPAAYIGMDRGRRFMYVAMNDPVPESSSIGIVDVSERKYLARVDVGGAAKACQVSSDQEHLICVHRAGGHLAKIHVVHMDERGDVTTIQAPSLSRNPGISRTTGRLWAPAHVGPENPISVDGSHVFFLYPSHEGQDPNGPGELLVFAAGAAQPVSLKFRHADDLQLSSDGKYAYVLDQGDYSSKTREYEDGRMYVVDAVAGKKIAEYQTGRVTDRGHSYFSLDQHSGRVWLLTHSSEWQPSYRIFQFVGEGAPVVVSAGVGVRFLARFPEDTGVWIVADKELRFLPGGGSQTEAAIPLNAPNPNGGLQPLGGVPGGMVNLRHQKKIAIQIVDETSGKNRDRIAILELPTKSFQTIEIGNPKTRRSNVLKTILALPTALLPGNLYGDLTPAISASFGLSSNEDGSLLYAANPATTDITVVQSSDGHVAGWIPLCCDWLRSTPDRRFLINHDWTSQVVWIDTRTNKAIFGQKLSTVSALHALYYYPEIGRAVVQQESSLTIWNTEDGSLVRELETPPSSFVGAGFRVD